MNPLGLLTKIRLLAMANVVIQGYCLGTNNTFRWFNTQLPKGYVGQGTCVTVQRISSVTDYFQGQPSALEWVRVQINIWDLSSIKAEALSNYLQNTFFPSSCFTSNAQFQSPPLAPPAAANFKLSQWGGLDPSIQPEVPWLERQDWRLANNTNI